MIEYTEVEGIYYEIDTKRKQGSSELETIKTEKFRFIGKLFQVSEELQFRLFQMQSDGAICLHIINNSQPIELNNMIVINGIEYRVLQESGSIFDRNIMLVRYDKDVAS